MRCSRRRATRICSSSTRPRREGALGGRASTGPFRCPRPGVRSNAVTTIPGDQLPAPGTVVAGKYVVERVIGEGGMGVVLEAHHRSLGQSVALKILRPSLLALEDVKVRFEREGRAVARLQGPHVARILDVDALDDGTPFMVMELLRGRELG